MIVVCRCGLADWQVFKKRAPKWLLRKAAKLNFVSPDKSEWCATMSADARGKESQTQSPNNFSKVAWIAGKMKDTGIKCSQNGHSKEEHTRMREELRDHAECHQPRHWREQTHSGGLKIEQSANVAMPKKLTENHPAVKILRELEQEQRIPGSNPTQEERHPSSSLSGRVRGGCRGNETVPTIVIQQGVSASDSQQADNPS